MGNSGSTIAASGNLLIGFVWLMGVVFGFLALSGISAPLPAKAYWIETLMWFIGPVLLVCGSASLLLGKLRRLALLATAVAAVVLTGIVSNATWDALHPQPLEMPPSIPFYGTLISVAIACDVFAAVLVLNWRQASRIVGAESGTEE